MAVANREPLARTHETRAMAKSLKVEAMNSHWMDHWLHSLSTKKMTKIHRVVAACVLLGSFSASLAMLATVILASSNLLELAPSRQSIACDFSHHSTSVCEIKGDVRVKGSELRVALVSSNRSSATLAKIRPYTRKWEKMMKTIDEVRIESLPRSQRSKMRCNVSHKIPAVIFSTGGYTGNVFHDFNDGLVPLYITAQRFRGEVAILVLQFRHWWPGKYSQILSQITHYPVIDLEHSEQVHCFPEVIVGLRTHGDLLIDKDAAGRSMSDFQRLLGSGLDPTASSRREDLGRKPKLVLINRERSRMIVNKNETIELAERMGFEVHTFAPNFYTRMVDIYALLHSADVLLGVHGAALTHFLFMRPNSTLIQIIPFGLDGPAERCFAIPAARAGLNYVGYRIIASESTLTEEFGLNHTVVVNPGEVIARGWTERKKFYLDGQNIRLSLPRFEKILKDVFTRVRKPDPHRV